MNIRPSTGKYIVYASDYCHLDSDVSNGGGTDDTAVLQEILDKAKEWGMLHLIMDGAALIKGLRIQSNTTIECLNSDCGFYLADYSDDALLKNYDLSTGEIKNRNITLKGGSYNHNCMNQNSELPEERHFPKNEFCNSVVTAFKFFGVENFVMDGVTIIDQKRYALIMGNWKNVDMKNISIPLPHEVPATNQDGLHFHGPGEHLRLTNITGRTGDDFIALNTDEGDGVSSINDVLIDGVYLDNSDQAVRILAYNKGKIDNVVIRNVSGKFKSYGFFIQPYFKGEAGGKTGNITFENINLEQTNHIYWGEPRLFHISGNVEYINMRNISVKYNDKEFVPVFIHNPYEGKYHDCEDTTNIRHINIDGLYISDEREDHADAVYVRVKKDVESLHIKNVLIDRTEAMKDSGAFISIDEGNKIKDLSIENVSCDNIAQIIKK